MDCLMTKLLQLRRIQNFNTESIDFREGGGEFERWENYLTRQFQKGASAISDIFLSFEI